MENTNRSLFALDGITGMLLATVLLLLILAFLVIQALGVQQGNAATYYELKNEKSIKMISTENAAHRVVVQ